MAKQDHVSSKPTGPFCPSCSPSPRDTSRSSLSDLFSLGFVLCCGLLSVDCCFLSVLGNGTSGCYYFHEHCFLMGTVAKACLQGSDLLVQQHFRWVQLRWDGEPMQSLLPRFLRRRAVSKVTTAAAAWCWERGCGVRRPGPSSAIYLLTVRPWAGAIFGYSKVK